MPPTEDWIQESLARLESLEEERNRHEAALETATDPAVLRMNAQAIERLDAKIRSLYAELEAAAEQGEEAGADEEVAAEADEEDVGTNETTAMFHRDTLVAQATAGKAAAAPAPAAAPVQAAAPVRAAAAVAAAAPVSNPVASPVSSPFGGAPTSTPTASPFGGAPASTPTASPFGGGAPAAAPFSAGGEASPFGEVPVQAPFGSSPQPSSGFSSSSPMASTSFDAGNSFDEESSGGGGGAKWGIIIGVVLLLGIGGYFALGGKKEEPAPAEPTGPTKVLKAGEVPPDTQGPKTVKGSDVDAIKGTQFKEGRPNYGGGGGGGGSNNSAPAADKGKKKDPRAKIESTDDPLAGIDK